MESITLEVQPRQITGKRVRRLRRQGQTPIHIYGSNTEPITAQADTLTLSRVITEAGRTTPVAVTLDGVPHFTFIREIQLHPVTGHVLHVDFLQVDVREKMEGEVPLVLEGEAPAVRLRGGALAQNLHAVTVECLPTDMPHEIVVDISGLEDIGDTIHVRDIVAPPGVTILQDPEELVVRVTAPTRAEVEEAVEEEAVEEAAAAPAEAPEEAAAGESQGEEE